MVEWVKVGTNVVVGGAAGAVDQLVQNADEKREAEKGARLPTMSQYGTYYNYGVPILAVIGTAMGWLKGDWATRMLVAGSTLAGRKVTWQVTKRGSPSAWVPWSRQRQIAASKPRAQVSGDISPVNIPVIADEAILV